MAEAQGGGVSAVRSWVRSWIELIDQYLQVFLFGLMCIGLVLASLFLWHGKLTGGEWSAVCLGLFGSNALGGSLTQLAKSKGAPLDNGYQRPIA